MRSAPRTPITPIHLPPSARSGGVIVFGGSFDPPHLWHTRIAAAARRDLFGPDGCIVFVPAAKSPFKAQGPSASDEDRVRMLRIATRRLPNTLIWTDEIDRAHAQGGRASYTIESLKRLRSQIGGSDRNDPTLRLLIGADQAVSFHKWRQARAIIRLAEPCIALRPPFTTQDELLDAMSETDAWTRAELKSWRARILTVSPRAISSSRVRAAGGRGKIPPGNLNAEVARYIKNQALYN